MDQFLDGLHSYYLQAEGQYKTVFKFEIIRDMQERYPGDSICWIDADMLILAPLAPLMKEDFTNVISHGRRDDQELNMGNGLFISGSKYAIGGVFSIPNRDTLDELARIRSVAPYWKEIGPFASQIEQLIINHLVHDREHQVHWLTDNTDFIFNLEVGENLHPVVGDRLLQEIRLDVDGFFRGGRRFAVFCWIKNKLDAHILDDFRTFDVAVAQMLREFYA